MDIAAGRGSIETSLSGLTDTSGGSSFVDTYQAGASTTTTTGVTPGWRVTNLLTKVSTNKGPNSPVPTASNPAELHDQVFASFDWLDG